METTKEMQKCAMCGGRFPGPGIESEGKSYCCDRCANFQQHKFKMIAAMAPKLAGVLGIAAIFGYIIKHNRHRMP